MRNTMHYRRLKIACFLSLLFLLFQIQISLAASCGEEWIKRNTSPGSTLWGIAWSGNQFVAVGDAGTILSSPDGIAWTAQTSGAASDLQSIVWNGNRFLAVGENSTILTSPDGAAWSGGTLGTATTLSGVAWNGSRYVAVGSGGTVLTSLDGANWTPGTSGTDKWLRSVAWIGSRFIAVGDVGTILLSTDGSTWTSRASGTNVLLNSVASTYNGVVVAGNDGVLLTSPDGFFWTLATTGTTRPLAGVAATGPGVAADQIVVVGYRTILTSPDGAAWTAHNPGSGIGALTSIAWDGGQFVAVGDVGIILASSCKASVDTEPDPFSFPPVTGAEPKQPVTSDSITVQGMDGNALADISIVGGKYSINDGAFTGKNGTVKLDDRVRVRLTSSAQPGTTATATLTIGGISGEFRVTTKPDAGDTEPDPFSFPPVTGAELNQPVVSDPVTVQGIDRPASISIVGGKYSINGGDFTARMGQVKLNDRVRVRVTSAGSYATTVTATLNMGGMEGSFTVTTRNEPPSSCDTPANWAADLADPVDLPPVVSGGKTYGQSIAASCEWLWIGAPQATAGGQKNRGAVFWWRKSQRGDWQAITAPVSEGSAGDAFGGALAINEPWAVVGAPKADRGDLRDIGRIYLYRRQEQTWQLASRLESGLSRNREQFGSAVALNDGWLAVGAPGPQKSAETDNGDGAVHLYSLQRGKWKYRQTLLPGSEHREGRFGASLALEGGHLIVGAPTEHLDRSDNLGSGAVYAYRLSGDEWIPDTAFTMPDLNDHKDGQFGSVLALQGNTLVISAPLTSFFENTEPHAQAGRVFLYVWSEEAETWHRSANFLQEKGEHLSPGNQFGSSLALANAGQWLLAGAPGADLSKRVQNSGRAYLYQIEGLGGTIAQSIDGTDKNQGLGRSAALLPNAAIIGAQSGQVLLYQPK